MPPTEKSCTSFLSVTLDRSRGVYAPGDTIYGQVIRRQPLVSADASITLTLHGYAKTRLDFGLENQKVRRSQFQLIDELNTRQLLHNGPIHMPPGGGQPLVLPFTTTIPTHVPGSLATCGLTSYLPLDPTSLTQQELPSTMVASSRHGRVEAFIEYYLEATLRINGDEITLATLPIVIENRPSCAPINDPTINYSQHFCTVSSERLVPGTKPKTELSLKDKMKMAFSSDPVPRFGFRLDVGVPAEIQLEDTEHIPLVMRASPDERFTSDAIRGIPQGILLRNMRMTLGSKTVARADRTTGSQELESEAKTEIPIDRVFSAFILQGKKVVIPCSEESQGLDVGKVVNLQLHHDGPTGIWKKLPGPSSHIHPTTVAYNFQVRHCLYWEALLDVAGEECKVKGQQDVHILPPANTEEPYTRPPPLEELPSNESWMQPPPEEEAPPSFADVQREDARAADSRIAV